ncbi:MAG: hypothetical protein MZV64_16585 [Ignavibacteriales bacterium]|nr:hypothetical protein [Ignavibacteriales bacterium]
MLAYGLGVPFVGVNHMEGHLYSNSWVSDPGVSVPLPRRLRVGTRCLCMCGRRSTSPSSVKRAMTLPGRPSTRWRRCLGSGTPAGRSSTDGGRGRNARHSVSAVGSRRGIRIQFQRHQDSRPLSSQACWPRALSAQATRPTNGR